ncbi:MAG: 2-C-methyl-D-erythritol 4-phosphate cytidylyltransferase [Gammaproteobacteria bacterium]|jgi:2-C-methyl-D-erythritol 4-phosphate cytidylyltransferase
MTAEPRYWAIVPAAGSGRRMAAALPKQYLRLGDRTVLEHTLDTLLAVEALAGVVLVVAPDDGDWAALRPRYAGQHLDVVNGGAERCHSVLNGLDALDGKAAAGDWVLVHDAARPCVRRDDIRALMTGVDADSDGGLLGVPVADTMKRVAADGRVAETVDRGGLWHALTPQMFRLEPLRAALRQAIATHSPVTDEASAMELAGYRPLMVQGHRDNIKITLPADLKLAAFYLQAGIR